MLFNKNNLGVILNPNLQRNSNVLLKENLNLFINSESNKILIYYILDFDCNNIENQRLCNSEVICDEINYLERFHKFFYFKYVI